MALPNKWAVFREHFMEHLWNYFGMFAWVFLMLHLMLIKTRSSVLIYEDIEVVINTELVIVPVIIVIGIVRDIKDWLKLKDVTLGGG